MIKYPPEEINRRLLKLYEMALKAHKRKVERQLADEETKNISSACDNNGGTNKPTTSRSDGDR